MKFFSLCIRVDIPNFAFEKSALKETKYSKNVKSFSMFDLFPQLLKEYPEFKDTPIRYLAYFLIERTEFFDI